MTNVAEFRNTAFPSTTAFHHGICEPETSTIIARICILKDDFQQGSSRVIRWNLTLALAHVPRIRDLERTLMSVASHLVARLYIIHPKIATSFTF